MYRYCAVSLNFAAVSKQQPQGRAASSVMRWTRALMAGPKTPTNFVQDGPPVGGFPTVNVKRSLPGGGMSSLAMAGFSVLTFTFGMYKIISYNGLRRCASETSHAIPQFHRDPQAAPAAITLDSSADACRML